MAGFKDKRDLNRYQRTSLASSGRSAGMGILCDRYDEESGYRTIACERCFKLAEYSQEEWEEKTKPQPVVKYKISKKEAKLL